MHTTVRRYTMGAGTAADLAKKVEEGFVPLIKDIDGFNGYYVIDGGNNVVVSISVFEEEAQAEESNEVAAGWVPDALAEFEPTAPEVTQGEVLVSVSS